MAVPQVALDAAVHYLNKGISKDVATGIVSVLYAGESKLNPGSQGTQSTETGGALNPHGAYGIGSWNGPRQQDLADFAKAKGLDVGALDTQLDFVLTESANSYPKVWAAINRPGITYAELIPIFVDYYEVPANKQAEIARSLAFAQELYAALPAAPQPAPTPAPTPAPVSPAPQGVTMEAFLTALIPILSPIIVQQGPAILMALIQGWAQNTTSTPTTSTTVLPPTLAADIAAEIAKILQIKPSS